MGDDARVLLLLSRDESASGANLTTANHAIFVHPLLTTSQYEYEASETQAIGRIRRYGQTRLVKVWRFLVKDSIDAEVFKQRTDAMTVAALIAVCFLFGFFVLARLFARRAKRSSRA